MTEEHDAGDGWYTRPIFSVRDVGAAFEHYCGQLGFVQAWAYDEDGEVIVAQVDKGSFELILTSNLDRVGAGRVFVALEESELEALLADIDAHGIAVEPIHWGYPAIRIQDPDGNEMIVPTEV